MARLLKFLLSLLSLISVTLLLNVNVDLLPPIGKFLNPFQGFLQNAEFGNSHMLPSLVKLKGLKEEVALTFDENLIPHIKAKNDHDMYLVQGYVSAYHRLWQMDFQYYAASGRLSEIFGNKTLFYDRLQRRKGLSKIADVIINNAQSDPMLMDILNAYTAGVNAFINSLSYKELPLEYKIFDYKPELWSPLKTAFINAFMIDILSGKDAALEYTNALNILGREKFDFIYPDYPNGVHPIIPNDLAIEFKSNKNNYNPSISKVIKDRFPKASSSNGGSNNWVLSSSKTADNEIFLANDPHLDLRLPSSWYLVCLETPDNKAFGASSPGAPSIVIGFNEHIAWGITNSMFNVRDWYEIEFTDKERTTYMYDGQLVKSEFIVENIKVRSSKTFYDTVVYTKHGPIVYDETFNDNAHHSNLAMRWLGHMPDKEILTFHLVSKARSYNDFKRAFDFYSVPNLNFAFACKDNTIAMDIVGKMPIKWKEQGKFIMPGNKSEYLWSDFVPNEHMPQCYNPQSGYLLSANQHPTNEQYPYYHHGHSYRYYRHRRIDQILKNINNATLKDMIDLQSDNYNLSASESLPLLINYVIYDNLNESEKKVFNELKKWDFLDTIEQIYPSIFKAWATNLSNELWKFLDQGDVKLKKPNFYVTIDIIKNYPKSEHLNFGSHDDLENLVTNSFKKSINELNEWSVKNKKPYKWGDYKSMSINHLALLDAFSIKHIRVDGSIESVNANEEGLGTSVKLIAELGRESKGWVIYPGGQSGNPGSKHYLSMLDKWLNNEYITVNLAKKEPIQPLFKIIFKP